MIFTITLFTRPSDSGMLLDSDGASAMVYVVGLKKSDSDSFSSSVIWNTVSIIYKIYSDNYSIFVLFTLIHILLSCVCVFQRLCVFAII